MRWIPGLFATALLIAAPVVAPAFAEDIAWPGSEPGRHARAYWQEHGSAAALVQRPVEARLGVWRNMRADFGVLTPVRVTNSGDDFVEVLARGAHGAGIAIRFLCDASPPHGLVGLRVGDPDETPAPGASQGPSPAADMGPPPTEEQVVAVLRSELDSLAAAGAFSGAALLDKDGRALFRKAYGMALRENGVANRIDTRFNLGSINKIFTSTAIQQLVNAGKLRYEDTIDTYLPDYRKADASRITVRMLVDHRSGVPDVLTSPGLDDHPARVRSMADWYGLVREMPLDFEPGSRQEYSNGGYVLLGQIITKSSGEDYYDYIRRHIYQPAKMTRSDHYAIDQKVDGIATSYTRRDRPAGGNATGDALLPIAAGHRYGRGSPAGGGHSTVEDLARFTAALRDGRLTGPHAPDKPPGFGIAGGSPGVNGLLILHGPYTLAVLANVDPPAAERLARTVGRMLRRIGATPGAPGKVVRVGGGS
jgi:D-alanyl-D-alanine carboxypeptidase